MTSPRVSSLTGHVHGPGTEAARVEAFDRDLAGDLALGGSVIAADGTYAIGYRLTGLERRGKRAPDLVVKVVGRRGEVLAESPVRFRAGRSERIDVTVPDGGSPPSLAERHLAQLRRGLGRTRLETLGEPDRRFLSRQAGIPDAEVDLLAEGGRLEAETGVPASFFYGLSRAGLPTDPTVLAMLPAERLRAAYEESVAAGLAPADLSGRAAELAKKISAGVAPRLAASETVRPLTALAKTAGLGERDRDRLLAAVAETDDDAPEKLWERLARELPAASVTRIEEAARLDAVLGARTELLEGLEGRGVQSLLELARLDERELAAALAAARPPAGDEPPAEVVDRDVAEIRAALEDAAPATVARVALERGPLAGIDPARHDDLLRLLERAAHVDLRRDRLDGLLTEDPALFAGLGDREATLGELRRVGRVLRVVPRFDQAATLLEAGLDSSRAIARTARSEFLASHGERLGGEEAAAAIHDRARAVHDAATLALTAFTQSVRDVAPAATAIDREPLADLFGKRLPDLASLFGNQSTCACRHCRSVLSPAAYLVDLLEWIGPRGREELLGAPGNAGRRPDLARLRLTCENTNTAFPHIDLVNEILEYQVVHGSLDAGAVRDTGDRTRDELLADPAFVTDAAYEVLAGAVHPRGLPFHRPLAVVRGYLEHLGVSRLAVLERFGRAGAPGADELVAERLGLDAVEWAIVAGTSGKSQQELYGGRSRTQLANLAVFLEATGDTVDEVQALLATRFVNDDGALELSIDPGCDPAKSRLTGLTAARLERIHRFSRLARSLGWSPADLDRAVATLGGEIDAALLSRLATTREILRRTRFRDLQTLLSLWGDLDWRGDDSLYRRLFARRDLVAGDRALAVPASGPPPAGAEERLVDHAAAIQSALRLSAADLAVLRAALGLSDEAPLTLANLSAIHRRVALARAVGVRLADLDGLTTLTGIDPFAGPEATLDLVTALDELRGSGVSLSRLQELLRHLEPPGAGEGAATAQALGALATGLAQLAAVPGDAAGAAAEAAETLERELVVAWLAETLRTPAPIARVLVVDLLRSTTGSGAPLVDDFLALAGSDPSAAALDAGGRARRLAAKAAALATGLGLDAAELALLGHHPEILGGFPWQSLPVERDAGAAAVDAAAPALFAAWRRLARFVAARDRLPAGEVRLAEVAAADGLEGALATLAAATGWEPALVAELCGPTGLGLAAADLGAPETFERLVECERLVARTGADPATLFRWAAAEPTADDARDLGRIVRGRYDEARWAEVGRRLNDPLRERQRDALVAYLVARLGLSGPDALYQRLLLDVQMAACQETSRVRAAIASVQLFVQRVLLNLEPSVSPATLDAEEWEWMASYRVWEANRKVFLWPENWIEPELRDDKSPFFRELESELLQGDLTEAAAERAFLGYLQKLHQVARLEVCGLARDPGDGVLHVVARTLDTPRVYFHRRRALGHWTPWERVDMEIEGEHAVPFVQDRRLYLFWLHFEERQDETPQLEVPRVESYDHWLWRTKTQPDWEANEYREWQEEHQAWQEVRDLVTAYDSLLRAAGLAQSDIDAAKEAVLEAHPIGKEAEPVEPRPPQEPPRSLAEPLKHWRVKLCWSEYKDGVWSPREASAETLISPMEIRTLGGLLDGSGLAGLIQALILAGLEIGAGDAVASQFLPRQEDHTLKLARLAGGRLEVRIQRRFEWRAPLPGLAIDARGADDLGRFVFRCGGRVVAQSAATPDHMQATPLDFADLPRPDGATNRANFLVGPGPLRLTAGGKTRGILTAMPDGPWSLVQEADPGGLALTPPFERFVFQDGGATWLAEPTPPVTLKGRAGKIAVRQAGLRFQTLFHPHVCAFLDTLYADGLPGLLSRDSQQRTQDGQGNRFASLYQPSSLVASPRPELAVELDGDGAYSIYNWELFFHVPVLIATALTRQQRFEAARRWFHFVFDPTTGSAEPSPGRYWNFLPFHGNLAPAKEDVRALLDALADGDADGKVARQIAAWRDDPFNPHRLARLRITAYQKHVVGRYIELLIAWGDHLFAADTSETVSEAAMLYVLAGALLGPRPLELPGAEAPPRTYDDLRKDLDDFGNALVTLEDEPGLARFGVAPGPWSELAATAVSRQRLPAFQSRRSVAGSGDAVGGRSPDAPAARAARRETYGEWGVARPAALSARRASRRGVRGALTHGLRPGRGTRVIADLHALPYFCVPRNDVLLRHWDLVEDRLFKIRHCLDLDGVARQLALFEPPIDPALLVRARAAGLDLGAVATQAHAPLPAHRFSFVLAKARELCAELKALGGSLLSALEKRDGEALALLRSGHELRLLEAVREVRKLAIAEATAAKEGLERTRRIAEARRDFYAAIERTSAGERDHMDSLADAHTLSQVAHGISAGAAGGFMLPSIDIGTAGWAASPLAKVSFGGNNVGNAVKAVAEVIGLVAAQFSQDAALASIKAGYDRRWNDWKLQEKLALREIDQIDRQIVAAELGQELARAELANQELQLEHSRQVESFLHSKVTDEGLYDWLVGQVSREYFQAYKLAFDLARRAERCLRFERGGAEGEIVRFDAWDGLRKGLLAGERLSLDLQRLEAAYLATDGREYELTKHVSLARLDPLGLIALVETGRCEIELPESLFDADYPGHYMRRLKQVSLSIPCVVGPYTSVNCTLTLLASEVRRDGVAQADYRRSPDGDDPRFVSDFAAVQSIATSHGQNDAGMFQLDFRDERYLPFEGAGAISRWRIELPRETNAFDFASITDLILHLRYTARDGGEALRASAAAAREEALADLEGTPQMRLFRLRHDFPDAWHRFLHPAPGSPARALLPISSDLFPFLFRGRPLDLFRCELFLELDDRVPAGSSRSFAEVGATAVLAGKLTPPGGSALPFELVGDGSSGGAMLRATIDLAVAIGSPAEWTLELDPASVAALDPMLRTPEGRLVPEAVGDVWLVTAYTVGS